MLEKFTELMPLSKHRLLERMIFKFITLKYGNFECATAHIHQDINALTLLAIWFSFIINSIIIHHQLHQFKSNQIRQIKRIAEDLVSFALLMTLGRSHDIKIFTKKKPVSIQILEQNFENLAAIFIYVHKKLQKNSSLKNDKTNVFTVKLSPNFSRTEPTI